MAKVTRDLSARSYIATENFAGDFFSYVVKKVNFNTVGTLSPVTTTLANCPAGRVLRENGRKLAPGMNPNVSTYMVGVYDNQSGLSGFIDPNSPVFAVYSNDRPNFLIDNVDPGDGANGGSQHSTDHSAPVLTNGLVSAATTVSAGLTVTAGTGVTATTGNITATTGNLVATAGKLVVGSNSVGTTNLPGGGNSTNTGVQVNTSMCNASTSKIFVTYTSNNNIGSLYVTDVSNGSFRIRSSNGNDSSSVNWFIVN